MDTDEEQLKTWQTYDLQTREDGSIRGWAETNDDGDTGYPGEQARWSVRYRNFDEMKKVTGLSHVGCIGCEVTVRLDGKKI